MANSPWTTLPLSPPLFFVTRQNVDSLAPLPPFSHMDSFRLPLLPRTSSVSLDFYMIFLNLCVSLLSIIYTCRQWKPAPYWLSTSSLSNSFHCHASGRLCESAVRWRGERESGRMGGGNEKRREREVVDHCSADKLMQQSRLSQQHTPSLAQCLLQCVAMHCSLGDRLPR